MVVKSTLESITRKDLEKESKRGGKIRRRERQGKKRRKGMRE